MLGDMKTSFSDALKSTEPLPLPKQLLLLKFLLHLK
jgi:hypothetical protein